MSTVNPFSRLTTLPQGALIQRFTLDPTSDPPLNLVLALPSAAAYAEHNAPYLGETIGRVSNRIGKSHIHDLNDTSYKLHANETEATLHGGAEGWGKKVFSGPERTQRHGKEAEMWTYTSEHMDEGFPGTVKLSVWYTPEVVQEQGQEVTRLTIEYEAELIDSTVLETIVAVTNHTYFNISGTPTLTGTTCTLPSTLHQVVDADSIPTGELAPFPGLTPARPFTFTDTSPSIDHSFIVDPAFHPSPTPRPSSVSLDTRAGPLREAIRLHSDATGVTLSVATTEPAVQIYTGEGIETPAVEGWRALGARAGLAVEPQRFVDAAAWPEWRGQVLLRRGEVWGSRSVWSAWREVRS